MHSSRQLLNMKRPKSPSPPATPQPSNPIPKKPRNIPQPVPTTTTINFKPLNIPKSELYLPLTFPTGQTFRWKQTGPSQYTGPIGSHLVSLKQLDDYTVGYFCHFTDDDEHVARSDLFEFLNMGVCLGEVWDGFRACDERFAELALYLEGARVLRQEPLECLVQFICSSNNNIKRITKMVDFVSGMGRFLGSAGGFEFFEFPTLERLALVTEAELREAGFGYRAKYIVGTVAALQSKPGGGVEWLASLRKLDLQGAVDGLCTLPGVGPKVAACIALFSLDQHHAIPVDTHVWQDLIARDLLDITRIYEIGNDSTRYLIPELAGTRLTPNSCSRVADAFVSKYGKYAGWAQTLLFISELPSQKAILPSSFWGTEERSVTKASNEKSVNTRTKENLVNERNAAGK